MAAFLLSACGSYPVAKDEADLSPLPDIPGVDFAALEPNPYPDLDRLFDDFKRSASSRGAYEVQGEKHLETEEPVGVVLQRYRDQLSHPSWDIQSENLEGPVAWLIWTVRDSEGHFWFGVLVAAPSGEGRVQVWLSLYSDNLMK